MLLSLSVTPFLQEHWRRAARRFDMRPFQDLIRSDNLNGELIMNASFRTVWLVFGKVYLGTEMGQAGFRLACAALFGIYLILTNHFAQAALFESVLSGVTAYIVFAFCWLLVVRFSLFTLPARRILAIVLDQGLFSVALFLGGQMLAPVMWAPIVVAIGNGLGNNDFYARLSYVLGAVFISIAVAHSPFWRSIPFVSQGLVLATVLVPWYATLLTKDIAQARRDLELRAAKFEIASRTDSLTGILNRAGFTHALENMIKNSDQNVACGTKSAVMFLDLDNFKAINDIGGHTAGDEALKAVAECLNQCSRTSDAIARISGDEFGILMRNLAVDEDIQLHAHGILNSIAKICIPSHEHLRLSASIGICVLFGSASISSKKIMEITDRLMYAAKNSGKNQFRILYGLTHNDEGS